MRSSEQSANTLHENVIVLSDSSCSVDSSGDELTELLLDGEGPTTKESVSIMVSYIVHFLVQCVLVSAIQKYAEISAT